MKITLCEAAHDEKGQLGYEAHEKGDQTTDEVRFHDWYGYVGYNKATPWTHIYRPISKDLANVIAIRMEEAARNSNIGYGQPSRNDIHDALAKDPSPAKISKKIDCDCSSLVNSIVWVSLKLIGITNVVTGYETTALMPQKYNARKDLFKDVINEVNLETGRGVMRGDILVRPGSHTAVVTEVTDDRSGVVSTGLYLRKGVGPLSLPITVMPKGSFVTILGEEKASNGTVWYQVQYKDKIGYCSSKYIVL